MEENINLRDDLIKEILNDLYVLSSDDELKVLKLLKELSEDKCEDLEKLINDIEMYNISKGD